MAELIIFVVLFHFLQDHLMEIIFKFNNRRLKIYVFSVFNYRMVFEFINLDTKNIRNYLFILNQFSFLLVGISFLVRDLHCNLLVVIYFIFSLMEFRKHIPLGSRLINFLIVNFIRQCFIHFILFFNQYLGHFLYLIPYKNINKYYLTII